MIKLIVFDFDGTLTPKKLDGNRMLSQYLGKEKQFNNIVNDYHDKKLTGEEAVEKLAQEYKGLTIKDIQKVRSKMKLRPGALETFKNIKARGIKTAIVTGEANHMMRDMLDLLKPDYFDGVDWIFDGDIFTGKIEWDFEYKKELVHHLMSKYNLKPEEVIGVGDTWFDKETLPEKVKFIGIGDEINHKTDFEINEIPEILDIIEKLNRA